LIRAFRRHDHRNVTDLSGVWDFAFLGDMDPDAVDTGAIDFDDSMAVPACFDATPAYAGRRGLAAYRTRLTFNGPGPYRLMLEGVHHWCRVVLDGAPLCDHAGGFTPFGVDIDEATEGELIILVDNRFDADRCPLHLEYFDWRHFGGVARGAELHRLGPVWIDAVRVVTEDWAARRLSIAVEYGATQPAPAVGLAVTFGGETILTETVDIETAGRLDRTIEVPGAALWSPGDPALHDLHIRLGDDDLHERVGIRQVAVDGRDVLINGRALRLLGVNRHEAHPQFGHTQPMDLLLSDAQQLKDLGCNFVRGSHYPLDGRFLDVCDRMGICVWCESIGWNHRVEHLTDERFVAAQLAHIDEMVPAAANHPSVIMWGVLNEGESDNIECRPAYERLLGRIRRLDPTRPVTYANNHWREDVCEDLADIVAINHYPGWYHGDIDGIPAALDAIVQRIAELGHADKPLIISEIGAGAVYGWRDRHETRWSEPYQARLLEKVIRHMFIDRDRFCGLAIWQFCDIRTSENVKTALGRPRGFNNKGLVDEYRREKLACETVRELFGRLSRAGGE